MPKPIFEETQRFNNQWVRLFACIGAGAIVASFARAVYQQLIRGIPWGDSPLSDPVLTALSVTMFALAGALVWLAFKLTLIVSLDRSVLRIRMFPLIHRRIPVSSIQEVEAVEYNPLREYGGWGIKWGGPKRGWAYNISGNLGVRLKVAGGKCILVGSLLPEELAEALNKARRA